MGLDNLQSQETIISVWRKPMPCWFTSLLGQQVASLFSLPLTGQPGRGGLQSVPLKKKHSGLKEITLGSDWSFWERDPLAKHLGGSWHTLHSPMWPQTPFASLWDVISLPCCWILHCQEAHGTHGHSGVLSVTQMDPPGPNEPHPGLAEHHK